MRTTTVLTSVLPLLIVVSPARMAWGETATDEEMSVVCRNWLAYMVHEKGSWAGDRKPTIVGVQELTDDDMLLAHCFSIAPRGHVVVPILKELPPVKAYSDACNLDVNKTVGLPQLLREVLEHRLRLYVWRYGSLDASQPRAADVLFDPVNRREWDRLLLSRDQFAADLNRGDRDPMTEAGPLLTTAWHQGSPYLNSCPMGDGGQTVVGCVATAAAQILNYHEWPPNGVGDHTYYWDGDGSCGGSPAGQWLFADFSDPYDWSNMPDDCGAGCSSAQEDALAELCYEVGVGYGMDYGACISGAYTELALSLLPTQFRYDPAIDREDRSDHTAGTWFGLVQDEINALRPILYSIYSHAIVCDGWRDTGGLDQYHMNYGWASSATTWYTVDNLYCPWSGCDPMFEFMIRNIQPWQPSDPDCNSNGTPDYQDIWDETSPDCNGNAIPDECDIADGASNDCQPDGVPDECQIAGVVLPPGGEPCSPTATNGEPWCDDFESYPLGSIQGLNGWQGWGPGQGDPGSAGIVTDEQNHTPSGSKSLKIVTHDTVHLFDGYDVGTSSCWVLSAWVYVPSDMTGTAWFIVNSDYNGGESGTKWSVVLQMNAIGGTIMSTEGLSWLLLSTDAWAEIRLEVDFEHDLATILYNDALLAMHTWSMGGGTFNVATVDLWSPDSSGFYYDDVSLIPTICADCNMNSVPDECDPDCNSSGTPDQCEPESSDVGLFVSQLLAATPDPALVCMFDGNADGVLDGRDVHFFVGCVIHGVCP